MFSFRYAPDFPGYFCYTIRDNGVSRSREENFVPDSEKPEITVFDITGLASVRNYIGKGGEIGLFRRSTKIKIIGNLDSESRLYFDFL